MRWKNILWFAAVVAVTSSLHATLENTIENELQVHDNGLHGPKEGDEEIQSTTSPPEQNQTVSEHNVTNITTENYTMIQEVTRDHSTINGEIESETVSVREPEYQTTENSENVTFPRSAEVNSNSEEYMESQSRLEVPVVITTSGSVHGFQWNENPNIISYIDIPYGMFKGRFQTPVPPDTADTVHENQEHSIRCPQLDGDEYVGVEDCLTLSIFSPPNVENASVLFHIYDGKFVSGSGDPFIYGPDYLVPQGVILVLPNYRLGPLGFMCLNNDIAPGNAALKDLTLALNWTRENIIHFGGDPYNIIVSGDGLSGALAGFLALSPKSKSLVNKVIIESGSVLSYLALDRSPTTKAEELLEKLDGQSIEEVDMRMLLTTAKDMEFKPCLENNTDAFMVETPWQMVNGENIDITFMIGTAMYAGTHEALQQTEESIRKLNDDYGQLLPNDLKFKSDEEKTIIGTKIKTQYFGDAEISLNDIPKLALCFTDAAYLGPGIRSARPLVEAGAVVYVYEFSFVGDFNRELVSINRPVDGAVRGDIIGYVFTQDGQVPHESSNEEKMVKTLVDLWINFMQHGQPSTENVEWNKLDNIKDSEEEEWLSIDIEPVMKQGIHVNRMNLWTDIYNEHFIEHNLANELSSSVYSVLIIQFMFWIAFFKNVPHLY